MDRLQPARLWNRRFVHLLAIEVMFQFGVYAINPIVSGYVVALGASLAVGGFVAGLHASSSMVCRPFTGWLADKLSKKTLLLAAACLFTVAACGCAVVPSVAFIGVFRALQGVAFAFRSAVVVSLVSLVVPQDHIGRAVGWIGLASTIACALGPMVGSYVSAAFGYSSCFVVAGMLFGIGLALVIAFKAPNASKRTRMAQPGDARERKTLGQRIAGMKPSDFFYTKALPYSVIAGLSGAPHGIAIALILLVGDYRGIEGVSIYFGVFSLAALVAKPLVGSVADKKGLLVAAAPMLLVELVGTVLLAFMSSLPFVVLAGLCMGTGQASVYSALQAESVRNVDAQQLGRASNTFYLAPDLEMGFGPLLAGFVMQIWGITTMFLFCSGLVVLALLFLVMHERRKKPQGS